MKAVLAELWHLFVDDARLAFGLVAWVAVAGIGLPALSLPGEAAGPILFLGAAMILTLTLKS